MTQIVGHDASRAAERVNLTTDDTRSNIAAGALSPVFGDHHIYFYLPTTEIDALCLFLPNGNSFKSNSIWSERNIYGGLRFGDSQIWFLF